MSVGLGFDSHRLAPGRRLVLGGVLVSYDRGLAGHSDADVLTHAVIDALLGAAGLDDIGAHFPSEDPRYADASSLELLRRVVVLLAGKRLQVENVDATIFAEQPRLAPYRSSMRRVLAETLGIEAARVNVKLKTLEGLGPLGLGEGMAAQAVAEVREL
ncbi:MAG: 2-C-methyl-D-erythritol 2,4-cyclodiphosphate synthase [Chloroflexi bacterium]|nr:2-C-methyl-D-erythritol 2,4-cyclodiphosphate synthase [Chloroflexota bacterium]